MIPMPRAVTGQVQRPANPVQYAPSAEDVLLLCTVRVLTSLKHAIPTVSITIFNFRILLKEKVPPVWGARLALQTRRLFDGQRTNILRANVRKLH